MSTQVRSAVRPTVRANAGTARRGLTRAQQVTKRSPVAVRTGNTTAAKKPGGRRSKTMGTL